MFLLLKLWITFDFHGMNEPRLRLDPSHHLAQVSACRRAPHAALGREGATRQECKEDGGEAGGPEQTAFQYRAFSGYHFPFQFEWEACKFRNNSKYSQNPVPTSQKEQIQRFYHTCFRNVRIPSVPSPVPFCSPSPDTTTVVNLVCIFQFMSFCFPYITYSKSVL